MSRDVAVLACALSAGVHAALVPEHGAAFVAATVLLAAAGMALALAPRATWPAQATAGLLGSLVVAYAAVGDVDAVGLATKAVELTGLAAALRSGGGTARSLPLPLTALAAVFAALLVTALHGYVPHHHGSS